MSHEAFLNGVCSGVTVYYRIVSNDRSGNSSQSQEYQARGVSSLFLPLVGK